MLREAKIAYARAQRAAMADFKADVSRQGQATGLNPEELGAAQRELVDAVVKGRGLVLRSVKGLTEGFRAEALRLGEGGETFAGLDAATLTYRRALLSAAEGLEASKTQLAQFTQVRNVGSTIEANLSQLDQAILAEVRAHREAAQLIQRQTRERATIPLRGANQQAVAEDYLTEDTSRRRRVVTLAEPALAEGGKGLEFDVAQHGALRQDLLDAASVTESKRAKAALETMANRVKEVGDAYELVRAEDELSANVGRQIPVKLSEGLANSARKLLPDTPIENGRINISSGEYPEVQERLGAVAAGPAQELAAEAEALARAIAAARDKIIARDAADPACVRAERISIGWRLIAPRLRCPWEPLIRPKPKPPVMLTNEHSGSGWRLPRRRPKRYVGVAQPRPKRRKRPRKQRLLLVNGQRRPESTGSPHDSSKTPPVEASMWGRGSGRTAGGFRSG
jgi:hypothetical protein